MAPISLTADSDDFTYSGGPGGVLTIRAAAGFAFGEDLNASAQEVDAINTIIERGWVAFDTTVIAGTVASVLFHVDMDHELGTPPAALGLVKKSGTETGNAAYAAIFSDFNAEGGSGDIGEMTRVDGRYSIAVPLAKWAVESSYQLAIVEWDHDHEGVNLKESEKCGGALVDATLEVTLGASTSSSNVVASPTTHDTFL